MRRAFLSIIAAALCCIHALAVDFDKHFKDETVKIDLSIVNEGPHRGIAIDTICRWDGWWGRRVNLDRTQYPEFLSYAVIDKKTGDTLYVDNKFLIGMHHADRAHPLRTTLQIPRPKKDAVLSVALGGRRHGLAHDFGLRKSDISKAQRLDSPATPYVFIRKAQDPKRAVTLAIVAEGYAHDEMWKFLSTAQLLDKAMFSQGGFSDNADKFNIVAVMLPSAESGVSRPSRGIKRNSALHSHFDSFSLDRLLTIPTSKMLWDMLAGVPAQQAIILANTDIYGGSGSYNDYCIGAADDYWWSQLILHEFGHSFFNLGDEYEDGYDISYTPDKEPEEPNITTQHDFRGKWQNLIDSGEGSLIEGAGYQSKGVWRGCEHCIMRALSDREFCPVCRQAINRTIDYYTIEGK